METRCENSGCDQPSATSLEGRSFCREHFIRTAYVLLDQAATRLEHAAFHGSEAESVIRALDDCMHATTNLAFALEKPENLERARLMDILLWASELCRRMRRGPRKSIAVPIDLRSGAAGREWSEATVTTTLSRYGASLFCKHETVHGDILRVRRVDTADEATARVVWVRRMANDSFEIGFELQDQNNFWQLDWRQGNL